MSYTSLFRSRAGKRYFFLTLLVSLVLFTVYSSVFPDVGPQMRSLRERAGSSYKNAATEPRVESDLLESSDDYNDNKDLPKKFLKDQRAEYPIKADPETPFPKRGCTPYTDYASMAHAPLSEGALRLPYQRPPPKCRTFSSPVIDQVVEYVKSRLKDKDLARLFENTFPNTLDTTVRWHRPRDNRVVADPAAWESQPQTFIVTGDINAEWLRDSTRQLKPYHRYANEDPKLKDLLLGAINTQAQFVIHAPYCNAFNPPLGSGIKFPSPKHDEVKPVHSPKFVFECKYELDSLAHFLEMSNDYFDQTGDASFISPKWLQALTQVLKVIEQQSITTYNGDGKVETNWYTFKRWTNAGTETLPLNGAGNPTGGDTQLIRSAFRPSDDATIFQFHIPSNAQMTVQLERTAKLLEPLHPKIAEGLRLRAAAIREGIMQHGVVDHKVFGQVFAYEVDGYGSSNMMDDANVPSLLSLPLLGFVEPDHPIYLNTRKMILSREGNPYYITGPYFHGIGGPHIGTRMAWPMSHIVEGRTLVRDDFKAAAARVNELLDTLKRSTSGMGLMHESVSVDRLGSWTRPWFAWCNSEMGAFILEALEHGYLETVPQEGEN